MAQHDAARIDPLQKNHVREESIEKVKISHPSHRSAALLGQQKYTRVCSPLRHGIKRVTIAATDENSCMASYYTSACCGEVT